MTQVLRRAADVLQPAEEIRTVAAGLGFTSTAPEAHGHDALEVRVAVSGAAAAWSLIASKENADRRRC
jgi:hypothetical protein